MKERLLKALERQKKIGESFSFRLESVTSSAMLDDLMADYVQWNKVNCDILENSYVHKQLFRMYSGVNYLGNAYDDSNLFQAKRNEILYCLPKQLGHLNTAINHTQDLRNTELLPFDEQVTIVQETKPRMTGMKKLFISHASVDANKVKPLIDLIESVGVSHSQIFFSSHEAYGVGLGENIFERLKRELEDEVFALFILSDNFYQSAVCLCEMGAVWIKSNKQIPVLIPPFDFKDVKGVFPNSLGFKINDKSQLNSFKEALMSYFDLPPVHTSRWEEKRDEYLLKVNALL
ncbi:MAG: toll/interleukin-1 receptor domain-containing protein [Janthinobacterium lividum]